MPGESQTQSRSGGHRHLCSGGVVTHDGYRLDRTRFPGTCLLSTNRPEALDLFANDAGTIPLNPRPRLSDLLPLLQGEETHEAGRTVSPGKPEDRGFCLRLLQESSGTGGSPLHQPYPDLSEDNYTAIGLLALALEDASEILPGRAHLAGEYLIRAAEVYSLMIGETAKWLARVPAALNLTSPERFERIPPIVASNRFDRAADQIFKSFLKPERNAVLLKGVAGTGKSCLIEKLAQDFMHMRVPSSLQGHAVAGLNIVPFMPSGHAVEEAEKSILRASMAKQRVIWVIDEASRLVERGNTAPLDSVLLFIDQGAKVILLSDQSYLLEKREAFMRRLNPVYLPPAEAEEVFNIASVLSEYLAGRAGLTIQPEALQAAVTYSYSAPFAQPHGVADLLSNVAASCELRGESEVTVSAVEREVGEVFAQGHGPSRLPTSTDEFIEMVRAEGFRGHHALLKELGRRFLRALRCRFRPERPPGPAWVCVLVGGHGVGKTMLLKIVGRMVTGAERKVLEINCRAFQKEHTLQSLLGSPMSYVGYGEGGLLQNFVKQSPDGVLIFQKPECGHPRILNLIHEILKGSFTAGDGQRISTARLFTLICSNVGCESIRANIGFTPDEPQRSVRVRDALEVAFGPGLSPLLDRKSIFYVEPLEPAALRNILRLEILNYSQSHGIPIGVEDEVLESIIRNAEAELYGARAVLIHYRDALEPLLDEQMEKVEHRGALEKISVTLDENGAIVCKAAHTTANSRDT